MHGVQDSGMLSHAEIIIRAPDHNFFSAAFVMHQRVGKLAAEPFQNRKRAVTTVFFKDGKVSFEMLTVLVGSPCHTILICRQNTRKGKQEVAPLNA